MKYNEVSLRYATALYDLSAEAGIQDKVFSNLRELNQVFKKDAEIKEFISSPLVKSTDKETAMKKALANGELTDQVKSFVLLLAKKGRLDLFNEIVEAYQTKSDEAHGVTRGDVVSTTVLSTEERSEVEKFVSEATGKKVILTYSEDSTLIGGLIAKVGSYTFDDSITSHMRRLKEDLKRSAL